MIWLIVLFVVVAYLVSLELHPMRRYRRCGGSGRQQGSLFRWGDRLCVRCGGQSRHRRWGAQAMHQNSKTWAEREVTKARKRRGAPRY